MARSNLLGGVAIRRHRLAHLLEVVGVDCRAWFESVCSTGSRSFARLVRWGTKAFASRSPVPADVPTNPLFRYFSNPTTAPPIPSANSPRAAGFDIVCSTAWLTSHQRVALGVLPASSSPLGPRASRWELPGGINVKL